MYTCFVLSYSVSIHFNCLCDSNTKRFKRMLTYFIRMLAVILFQIFITICVFGSFFAHKFTFWHGNTRTQFRGTFWKEWGILIIWSVTLVDYVEACLQMVPSSKSQLSWKKSCFQTVSDPHTNMPHGASPQTKSFILLWKFQVMEVVSKEVLVGIKISGGGGNRLHLTYAVTTRMVLH